MLGLAGVIPFAWGAATQSFPALSDFGQSTFGPRFVGPYIQIFYGSIILAFMSGVLWGFATGASGRTAKLGFYLSVLPALWTFFMVGAGAEESIRALIAGFLALLGLDYLYARLGMGPPWWLQLRVLLSVLVIGCLSLGLLA